MVEQGYLGFQVTEDFDAMLFNADCLDTMSEMPDSRIDAIVTDPPYGLSFMGKHWDHGVPAPDVWAECLRVLKPGGHLLSFAGTRTQHRMACNIEDAGFEIRDMIAWVFGSGFPKGADVGKQIDKAACATREIVGRHPCPARNVPGGNSLMMSITGMPDTAVITAPATEDAKKWDGWRSALKPALEPITVARKPFRGPLYRNVLEHGVGAFNVGGGRIGTERWATQGSNAAGGIYGDFTNDKPRTGVGRYPANLIHDGSDEVLAVFPDSKGQQGAVTGNEPRSKTNNVYGQFNGRPATEPRGDTGSAARFFYCAKANAKDRGEGNGHPTVKPTELMRYLCRLVTPPGGLVLDPFSGSGSTGKAARLEGFRFVGVEKEAEFYGTAFKRISEIENQEYRK